MKCLNPITVFYCGQVRAKDGVISPRLVFSFKEAVRYWQGILGTSSYLIAQERAYAHSHFLTCGKCAACQIQKRKDMTTRLSHECCMHDDACFITLTYDEKHVPYYDEWVPVQTLVPADVQKFIKRLRRHLEYVPKNAELAKKRDHVKGKIRYFCVGEYGSKSMRPHYHLIIFGWKPSDAYVWKLQKGYTINRSDQIEKLWKKGFSTVCEVNGGVAAYCARYVTKKFARLNEQTMDDCLRCPEFVLQSTRDGGIGALWLDKYSENLKQGFVNVKGSDGSIYKASIPRYYYDRLRKVNLPLWLDIRDMRIDWISKQSEICQVISKDKLDELSREVASAMEEIKKEAEREQI